MRRVYYVGLGLLALWLGACGAFFRPARGALSTQSFVERGPAQAKGLIVMLPGFGDRPSDFENHAFVERLAAHAPGYDLLGVDAHYNYYRTGRVLRRLEQDVLGPAKRQGYRELWLLGVSMGGLGAVTYARAHASDVSGVILFAPFWGRGQVLRSVADARSLCDWHPESVSAPMSVEDEAHLANWHWLRSSVCDQAGPPVWLAYGEQDVLSPAGRKVAEKLPGEHVVTLPGGHDWEAWARLLDVLSPRVFDPLAAREESIAQN